ncbi:hypothetical protein FZX01_12635 [Listeria monocytogenes]|uniref:hypothetical protein n=1 Tax=Listeria monocytogenes TaxID=1639 RepID=UPI0011EAD505|nr:hypothetical protein [Listeria monocytogenes]TYU85510.1 hypothetical protein FZX01_12635 [Listeria monocytogenes]
MKKLCKICSIVGITLLTVLGPVSTVTQAEEATNNPETKVEVLELSGKELKEQIKNEKELINEAKTNPENVKEIVVEYLESENNVVGNKLQEEELNPEDAVLVTNSGEALDNEYKIDDETSISFNGAGVEVVQVEESEERDATGAEDANLIEEETNEDLFSSISNNMKSFVFGKEVLAASSKTKSASHSRTAYSWLGPKLFTAKIAAKFTYNGSKVTAQTTENYIKKSFTGGLWSCYDKKNDVQKPSSKKRVVYQQGMCSWGLAVKGYGWTVQEKYVRVNVECNQNGTISKSSVLK